MTDMELFVCSSEHMKNGVAMASRLNYKVHNSRFIVWIARLRLCNDVG